MFFTIVTKLETKSYDDFLPPPLPPLSSLLSAPPLFLPALPHTDHGESRQLLFGHFMCREDGDGEDEQTAGDQQDTGQEEDKHNHSTQAWIFLLGFIYFQLSVSLYAFTETG